MHVPQPLHPNGATAQANLARILATTATQWGLARGWVDAAAVEKASQCSTNRPRNRPRERVPSAHVRVFAQTTLGLAWGWCY